MTTLISFLEAMTKFIRFKCCKGSCIRKDRWLYSHINHAIPIHSFALRLSYFLAATCPILSFVSINSHPKIPHYTAKFTIFSLCCVMFKVPKLSHYRRHIRGPLSLNLFQTPCFRQFHYISFE